MHCYACAYPEYIQLIFVDGHVASARSLLISDLVDALVTLVIITVKAWTYLGSEVKSQVAVVLQTVLDEEGNLVGQAQLNVVGQTAGLAKVDQVLERECEGDGLGEVDLNVVFIVLHVGVAAQLD